MGHAVVDEADAWALNFRWNLATEGYAYRSESGRTMIYLHREILGLVPGDGKLTDHKDRDRLNDRRGNLRVVTHSENMSNRAWGRCPYKGVSWASHAGRWRATKRVDGKRVHVGYFDTPEEAAAAL